MASTFERSRTMQRAERKFLSAVGVAMFVVLQACRPGAPLTSGDVASRSAGGAIPWWKGNTHTHSLWSDGDHFPEMIADWYRREGYHFLAMTDHNPPPPEKWVVVPDSGPRRRAYDLYRARFGDGWVEQRQAADTFRVRLRRLDEYRLQLDAAGNFLLVSGEEITQYRDGKAAHMNAVNIVEPIPEQSGATLNEILVNDLRAIGDQRARARRPIIGVLNHPNFIWSQTAEDIAALSELRFFEVYNGHPLVHMRGDSLHASTERMWDIVLTKRARRGEPLLYGVATDDAHDYLDFSPKERNPGRGWIVVRSPVLTADSLVAAMERGDFYASNGVELADVRRTRSSLSLLIRPEPGVTYVTQFIGTRVGYDTTSKAVRDSAGAALTRRYSEDVGQILAEGAGLSPRYSFQGDELYVRARVVSSKPKQNPAYEGEVEMAWIQPVWYLDAAR